MRAKTLPFLILSATLLAATALAAGTQTDRTAWYRQAKFGMFIHWGPYSLASVEASWPIMRPPKSGGITEAEYRALPERFNPTEYDPAAWVKLAKAAGQRYMVFTTKHHDGFCMFDSVYTNYKITNTPYKKDIVAELAAAAKKEGMPLGFYYSPPDLNHPGYRNTSKLSSTNWRGEPTRAEWALYLDYMQMQVTELLTRYGDVAIIWWDGLGGKAYDPHRFEKLLPELQPKTLMNNRVGAPGDYITPEQFVPKNIPSKRPLPPGTIPAPEDFQLWETCMTINGTWAYNKNDHRYKSATDLIRTLIEVASKGGNFLLNVGPTPEGTIQPEFQERLLAIGDWLKVNGDAIYGSTYGPIQGLASLRSTAKGKNVYLHVFDWPKGDLEITGLKAKVTDATLLAGSKKLTFRQSGDKLSIQVPAAAPDARASVIALKTK
jgi:alpha-L-fucosidase